MNEEKTVEQKEEKLEDLIRVMIMNDFDIRPSVAREMAKKAVDTIRKQLEKEMTDKK